MATARRGNRSHLSFRFEFEQSGLPASRLIAVALLCGLLLVAAALLWALLLFAGNPIRLVSGLVRDAFPLTRL